MLDSIYKLLKQQTDEIEYEKEHNAFKILGLLITYELLKKLGSLVGTGLGAASTLAYKVVFPSNK
jgi:hypothetical protein